MNLGFVSLLYLLMRLIWRILSTVSERGYHYRSVGHLIAMVSWPAEEWLERDRVPWCPNPQFWAWEGTWSCSALALAFDVSSPQRWFHASAANLAPPPCRSQRMGERWKWAGNHAVGETSWKGMGESGTWRAAKKGGSYCWPLQHGLTIPGRARTITRRLDSLGPGRPRGSHRRCSAPPTGPPGGAGPARSVRQGQSPVRAAATASWASRLELQQPRQARLQSQRPGHPGCSLTVPFPSAVPASSCVLPRLRHRRQRWALRTAPARPAPLSSCKNRAQNSSQPFLAHRRRKLGL